MIVINNHGMNNRHYRKSKMLILVVCALMLLGLAEAKESSFTPSLGQPCLSLDPDGTALDIIGFGGALFGDFRFNSKEDKAELFNRVCLQGEGGWRLEALGLIVTGISATPTFTAEMGRLSVDDWRLAADFINSREGGLELDNVRFYNEATRGSAEAVNYDIESGKVLMQELSAVAGNYRIEGAVGRLEDNVLIFEDALATTCVCEDETIYVIVSPEIDVNLLQERVTISKGTLTIGGTKISLAPNLVLDETSFVDLKSPLTVRYDGREPDGTGLEVLANLDVADGVVFQFGVIGADAAHDTNVVSLIKVKDEGVSATLGYAKGGGLQGDVAFTVPVNDNLDFEFGVNNRYFASQHYLREGYMALSYKQKIAFYEGISLSLNPRALLAMSGQTIGTSIVNSPRFNTSLGANFSAQSPVGTFGLNTKSEITTYPNYWHSEDNSWQYGIYINPNWALTIAEWQAKLSYQRRWTNAASPFSTKLDRLSELNKLDGSIRYSRPKVPSFQSISFEDRALVKNHFGFSLSASGSYDFLIDAANAEKLNDNDPKNDTSLQNPLRSLKFGVTGDWRYEQILLQASLSVETAALWSDIVDSKVNARIDGSLSASLSNGAVFGLRSRYYLEAISKKDENGKDVEQPLLDLLELNALYPFEIGQVTITPLLGLDFAPLITNTGGLGISSHGLTVAWANCCGTLTVGYKQRDDIWDVTLGLSVESRNRPEPDTTSVDPFGLEEPISNEGEPSSNP